jgi:hypothetical protein
MPSWIWVRIEPRSSRTIVVCATDALFYSYETRFKFISLYIQRARVEEVRPQKGDHPIFSDNPKDLPQNNFANTLSTPPPGFPISLDGRTFTFFGRRHGRSPNHFSFLGLRTAENVQFLAVGETKRFIMNYCQI